MAANDEPGSLPFQMIRCVHRNPHPQSEVWLARDETGREVALKLVARESDAEAQASRRERLQAEVNAGSVRHEHIRPLLMHGTDSKPTDTFPDGVDWIAFAWVEGPTLKELLETLVSLGRGGLTGPNLRDVTRAIANGLAAMHREKPSWIHRDVKPANVLIPKGGCRDALLADMGIAWRLGTPRLTFVAGQGVSGTPYYMAPEQFSADEEIGPACDLYALALVVWECAVGWVPHVQPNAQRSDIERARKKGAPLDALTVDGQPAPALHQVLVRALHREPAHRWSDVAAFWHAFHFAGVKDGCWSEDISFASGSDKKGMVAGALDHVPLAPLRSEFNLPEVWLEQAAYAKTFVGRSDVLRRLGAWIRSEGASSFLLVVGPPGQGKSALMAQLSLLEGAASLTMPARTGEGACLLHMVKRHREPRRILQFLLAQAERLLGVDFPEKTYQGSVEDLRNAFVARLEALLVRTRRVTILIDALDELLEDGKTFDFLPSRLPVGVKCVMSTRADSEVLAILKSRITGLEEEMLHSLSEQDGRDLLATTLSVDPATLARVLNIPELLELTDRHALSLVCAAEQKRPDVQRAIIQGTRERVSLDDVPRTMDAHFASWYASISGRRTADIDAEDGHARAAIVHVLTCAQEPLDKPQLRNILRAGGHDFTSEKLQGHLYGISQFVKCIDARYSLYPKGFSEFVRGEVDDDGAAKVHGWFLTWLSEERASPEYFRAHYSDHLRERWKALRKVSAEAELDALLSWSKGTTSMHYVRARVEAGEVFDVGGLFLPVLRKLRDALHQRETVRGRGARESLEEQVARTEEWSRFTRAQSYVLATHPKLLLQQLRNDPNTPILGAEAAAYPLPVPGLIVQERKPPNGAISRLRNRTVAIPSISSLAVDATGLHCLTAYDEKSLGYYNTLTGQVDMLDKEIVHVRVIGGGKHPIILTKHLKQRWKFTVRSSHYFLPEGVAGVGLVAATDRVVFAVFFFGGESPRRCLYRLDLETGSYSKLADLPLAVAAIAAPSHAGWVAIATDTAIAGSSPYVTESDISVFDGGTGAISSQARANHVSWLGVTASGLLVSDGSVWSAPGLHHLWSFGRGRTAWYMTALHPTLPKALLIGHDFVRVVDLESRTFTREETWLDVPHNCAALGRGGRVLIGDIGDFPDPPLGMWELPEEFWLDDHQKRDSELTDLLRGEIVWVSSITGRSITQVGGILLECEGCFHTPVRAFTGTVLDPLIGFKADCGAGRLLFQSEAGLQLFDMNRGEFFRQLRTTDTVHRILQCKRGTLVIWAQAYIDPLSAEDEALFIEDSFEEDYKKRNDEVIAEVLKRGLELKVLKTPGEDLLIPPLPWDPKRAAKLGWGVSLLDLATGAWSEFVQLEIADDKDRRSSCLEFMPGEEFLVFDQSGFNVQVIHARSGKVVVDLEPEEIVMKVMNAHQLYCSPCGGETSIVDVRDGSRIDCLLDLGSDPWIRGEHMGFDVSPDGRHAAWSTIEAITVSELRSGIEVARYPVRLGGWTLRFEDDRTIRAEGPFGEILVLRFEAAAEWT